MNADRAARPLIVVTGILLAISFTVGALLNRGYGFRGLASLDGWFNVDGESNIPMWVQMSMMLGIAALAWTLADNSRAANMPRLHCIGWRAISITFVYLSLDELVGLHERLDEPLHNLFRTSGALTWAWVIAAVPAVLLFAIAAVPLLRALPRSIALTMVAAGAVYVGGAIGLEMLGSSLYETQGPSSIAYRAEGTIEEGLESLGLILFLLSLARYQAALERAVQSLPAASSRVVGPAAVPDTVTLDLSSLGATDRDVAPRRRRHI